MFLVLNELLLYFLILPASRNLAGKSGRPLFCFITLKMKIPFWINSKFVIYQKVIKEAWSSWIVTHATSAWILNWRRPRNQVEKWLCFDRFWSKCHELLWLPSPEDQQCQTSVNLIDSSEYPCCWLHCSDCFVFNHFRLVLQPLDQHNF